MGQELVFLYSPTFKNPYGLFKWLMNRAIQQEV